MVVVKILGAIDLIAAFIFLLLIFNISPFLQITLFAAGLLLLKGMFIFTGEIPLSVIDLFAAIILLLSLAFTITPILLWIPALLLLAKGFVSFF